jgi:hypothetical protein
VVPGAHRLTGTLPQVRWLPGLQPGSEGPVDQLDAGVGEPVDERDLAVIEQGGDELRERLV